MAAENLEQWVIGELTKLLGIDASSVNDISNYLLSIPTEDELVGFVKELLTGSGDEASLDGPQRDFIRELVVRWQRISAPENMVAYKKEDTSKSRKNVSKQKALKKMESKINPFDMTAVNESLNELSPSKKSKKKTNYVSLYGQDGEVRTNAVRLPGRHSCECQAQKHKLVNNCLGCGRVVCEQEGSGPCLFCGELVCTRKEREVLARKSNKSEKLHKKLMSVPGGKALTKAENDKNIANALEKARAYKERLLNYDRTCAQRTRVIDDESDYFATDANVWLSDKERKLLKAKQEENYERRHGSRLNRKVTLDFAGRRVIDDMHDNYDVTKDEDVMSANFGGSFSNSFNEREVSEEIHLDESFPGLVNPNVRGHVPTLVTVEDYADDKTDNVWSKPNNRLQDKQLMEMSDPGMCLSMHQPWASLLVRGIKMDEGRSWYSGHRGRLWIAAASKQPTKDEISLVEEEHRRHWESIDELDSVPEFPTSYPVGCLLGCVDVREVLSQDDYRESYPRGESVAAYVFVCENPRELAVKFPVKGKHKIWRLDRNVHRPAKSSLQM
ncbi:activating signal cointegrator 1-like isoform X1 [Clavelina lepadiformis]|uniref:activating signal cointegrator 1-like isoform X1 n=2 Tax=Clavelina lepadiformis TaxID=159417 RepID=UPI0040438984